jgi:hypothetical protein
MERQGKMDFLSFNRTEDQFLLATVACLVLSYVFGMINGTIYAILWGILGFAALACIYFAFPYLWTFGLLLYAIYGICAFGVILIIFWREQFLLFGASVPMLAGGFFFFAAVYIAFHIVQSIKKGRDANVKSGDYLPLGFWSMSVMLFPVLSILSILGWALWANSQEFGIVIYQVLEPLIIFLLVYIIWLPDRNIDWSYKELPKSPATQFISQKTQVVKQKVTKIRNICPECGSKLKIEKKTCPSCGNTQSFGWCMKSETYVLPCANCGTMTLYGKDKCPNCNKELEKSISCNSCMKEFPAKEWIVES